MDVADRLRDARLGLGKTQEQVAFESNMNVTQYNAYERGRSRPAPATLARIAEALQSTSQALAGQPPAVDAAPTTAHGEDALRRLKAEFQAQAAAILGVSPTAIAIRIEVL